MPVLLKNAVIADGESPHLRRADILITSGVIADIRPTITARAEAFDLSGLYAAPGFIDAHSHDDCLMPGENKLRQGVTAEITGNCGLGYFPMGEGMSGYLHGAGLPARGFAAGDYAEYLRLLQQARPATRHAALVPHGNIRHASGGDIGRMVSLLERCMGQGAVGLSAGLCYQPSCLAGPDELEALCRSVSARGGIFAVHLRDEFDTGKSLDECFSLAEKTGARLQISHIKAMGADSWGKAGEIIAEIEKARARH